MLAKKALLLVFAAWVVLAIHPGCGSKGTVSELEPFVSAEEDEEVEDEEGNQTIYIVDRTGKKWDVTYAVEELGMRTGGFQYGLGPNAIKPIIMPEMAEDGQWGYPLPSSYITVLGLIRGDEVRAYPLPVVSRHEIVDDVVGEEALAVAY